MLTVLLVAQTIVALAMIIIILIQRSGSDGLSGLSGGGSGGGGNNLFSGRASANILTRATSVLALLFMGICLTMGTIAAREGKEKRSLMDNPIIESTPEALEQQTSTDSSSTEDIINEENEPIVPLAQ